MQGLAEAVKDLRLPNFFEQGQRAYMLGVERRDNPLTHPGPRTLWERGWDAARDKFQAMMQRWKNE